MGARQDRWSAQVQPMAISARSFSSSASSSSSSACFVLASTESISWLVVVCEKPTAGCLRSLLPAAGNRLRSATGTDPVLSMRSSMTSCSRPSSSASSSVSSGCSPRGLFVIACAISSLSWCCSRSWSLSCQYLPSR